MSCKTINEAETRENEGKLTGKAFKYGMLKGLPQHTISKATRSNVQIKCFPGARLRVMKHYSIPPLSTTKPKNVILHVGTNYLHNKKPADIMKDARSYVTKSKILARTPQYPRSLQEIMMKVDSKSLR